MDLSFSITMVVWAAVGGRASLLGACIGAILINMIAAKRQRDRRLRRGLEGDHRPDLRAGRALPAARPRRASRRISSTRWRASRQRRGAKHLRVADRVVAGGGGTRWPAALTIDGLGVEFAGFKAVDSVSMLIEEGELRVLLGANGAGKTTLMDLISGKTTVTEGRVFLYDTDITNWEEHKIARAGVGRKFQIPSVFREFTRPPQPRSRELPESAACSPICGFGFRSARQAARR